MVKLLETFSIICVWIRLTGISALPRIARPKPAQFSARAPPGQQHRGELDSSGEPGHRGAGLHHRLWHRQSPFPDHQSGLQAALLHHREPR